MYTVSNNLSQAVYLLLNILGVAGAVCLLCKKDRRTDVSPHLALLGFWVFMMLWESNHRQLINQWSLYFIVAALGMYELWRLVFRRE